MKIQVLFLVEHLSDGGSERHLYDVARLLDPERFESHVIFFEGGIMSEKLAAEPHVRIHRFPPLVRTFSSAFPRTVRLLKRYIDEHGIRAVVTFHFLADFLGASTALLAPHVKVVSSRRDMGITRSSLHRLMGRLMGARINRYIAVSEAVKSATSRQEGVPLHKIEVVYNGTDFDRLLACDLDVAAERARLGIRPEEIVIGCVANFNPVKGHGTLVKAFSRLRRDLPGTSLRLLLAGDGPVRAAMEEEVRRLELGDRVLFVGHRPVPTREYLVSDIVVSPSDTEGFSNTIVEAMAFARPVVATAVGGTPEAVDDGRTGILIPPGNPEAMARALRDLVEDPQRRERLGAAAAVEARQRFERGGMMQRIESLIMDQVGSRG